MLKLLSLLLGTVFLFGQSVGAQTPRPAQWGKIVPADFVPAAYPVDSSAAAVVIADIGATTFEGNAKGGFSIIFKFYRRARVLHRRGFIIADVEIPLYVDGESTEELLDLKASCYNLEDGIVKETKLDPKTALFEDRLNRNRVIKRFTFPNLREGSMIEYQYSIRSDFVFNLQPWIFQGEFPRLWSEYTVSIPEFYYYVTLWQGYQPFFIREQKESFAQFVHTDESSTGPAVRTNFRASVTSYHWVMKDVPVLKEEAFSSAMSNHLARIEFQLAELRPPFPPRPVLGSWKEAAETLLRDEHFGEALGHDNPWLDEGLAEALAGDTPDAARPKKIYYWLQRHFTCTVHSARLMDKPLKTVWKNRSGNVAEINLLLVALLQKAGYKADPVLLSTRSNGYTYDQYPLLDRFNYVIARLLLNGTRYLLDASQPDLSFGQLAPEAYNGHARIVNAEAEVINLDADSILEKSLTSVMLLQGDGWHLTGNYQQTSGEVESRRLRALYHQQGEEALLDEYWRNFPPGFSVKQLSADSIGQPEAPLTIHFDLQWSPDSTGGLVYVDPLFGQGWRENPFRSGLRSYPVEMPYTIDETFQLQMELPAGFEPEALPGQAIIRLNEKNDGIFEYRIREENGVLEVRSRLRIRRTFFLPEEYAILRDFFDRVVRKHQEQIVLRRKTLSK